MSKHDSHFANYFSLVLGILIAIAIVLFAFARVVGSSTQGAQVKAEALQLASVHDRTKPFARVAIAGEDNAALAIVEKASATTTEAAPGLPIPKSAEDLYNSACSACHGTALIKAQGMPRERWDATIDWMIERHGMPEIDPADRTLIVDYLARTFPSRQRGRSNPFLR